MTDLMVPTGVGGSSGSLAGIGIVERVALGIVHANKEDAVLIK